MVYLSKGLLLWKPSETVSVSHCGALHKLFGARAELWLAGRHEPGRAEYPSQESLLTELAGLGIIEYNNNSNDGAALFRILINCAICPARVKPNPVLLNRAERFIWRWIKYAGLRLTIAELTLLSERGVRPVPGLLGEDNRQALTELLYTADTIADGILETIMEKSPARDETVRTVLGLLRKKKIYLI